MDMRRLLRGVVLLAGVGAAACGGGGHATTSVVTTGGGGNGGSGNGAGGSGGSGAVDPPGPPAPALGQQVDRAGRDGVNLAVTDPWGLMELFSFQNRDAYNRADDRSQWSALFRSRIEFSLGVWDGVDGTCGNQLLAGPSAAPGRYRALAELFADDVLLVDTSFSTCTTFMGVELRAMGQNVNDCGGRTPAMDSADALMSLVAAGTAGQKPDGTWLFTDGISSDKDGTPSLTDFPFLLASGIGTPGSATTGTIDPQQGILTCSNLGEARCNRAFNCWGRGNIPSQFSAAFGPEVDKCLRLMDADCRGLSATPHTQQCAVYDPQALRDCERKYSLATCQDVEAAGDGLLPGCGNLCAM
jgi:hypothetical protein